MSYSVKNTVDAQGLICPEPVMMLHTAVRDANAGDVIEVKATDPTTKRDIQQFCDFLGHKLLELKEEESLLLFYIQKSGA
ncbi:Sulfurtransferase TusA [Thalassocella blandensis]|nr:Sulfurtransferase TusA [Thalassocella blandensis]